MRPVFKPWELSCWPAIDATNTILIIIFSLGALMFYMVSIARD